MERYGYSSRSRYIKARKRKEMQGMARQCKVMARKGKERHGMARDGMRWHVKASKERHGMQGKERKRHENK
jgi:hypothetical protein